MAVGYDQYSPLFDLQPDAAIRGWYFLHYVDYYIASPKITEGWRSPERQAALYAQGRTLPGPIMTDVLSSKHTQGRAFDFDFVGWHPDHVPQSWWDTAGAIGEWLGLTWGGRWALGDFRHFEI